jgi:hypothetical protein
MRVTQQIATLAIALTAAGIRPLAGQIDYRNLDDHRPVQTEDAYPIERYAFELLVPYQYDDERGGDALHVFTPELGYGVLANAQIGLKLPFTAVDGADETDWGFAGPRVFALYNLNTEGRTLPGLAIRADVALPVGGFAGDNAQLTLKGIATRSWGSTRLHLNGGLTLGDQTGRPEVNAEPDWAMSLAADRTFLRQSLLVIGELGVLEASSSAPTEVTAGLGVRYQLTPTLVLDAGASRRLVERAGPDLGLTLGLSHAFALAGLMPRAAR